MATYDMQVEAPHTLPLIDENSSLSMQLALTSSLRTLFQFDDVMYGCWIYETVHYIATDETHSVAITISDLDIPLTPFALKQCDNNISKLYALLVALVQTSEETLRVQQSLLFNSDTPLATHVGLIFPEGGKLWRYMPDARATLMTAPLLSERDFFKAANFEL